MKSDNLTRLVLSIETLKDNIVIGYETSNNKNNNTNYGVKIYSRFKTNTVIQIEDEEKNKNQLTIYIINDNNIISIFNIKTSQILNFLSSLAIF